ncbi:unnamed protein product [Brassica oleracea var. botrytis]
MEVSRALFLMLTPVADTVITRLVRFWKARDVNKRGELMGVDTLLLDEKVFTYGVFLWMLILGHVPTLTSKQEPVRPLLAAGTMHHLTLEMLEAGLLGKKLYEAKVLVKSWLNFKELHELKHEYESGWRKFLEMIQEFRMFADHA